MADDFIYQIFNILTQKHGLGNQSHDLTFESLSTLTILCMHSSKVGSAPGSKEDPRGRPSLQGFPLRAWKMGLSSSCCSAESSYFLNFGVLYLPFQDETPMSWSTSKEG